MFNTHKINKELFIWTVVLKKIRPNVLCNIPQFPPHMFLKTMSLSKKKKTMSLSGRNDNHLCTHEPLKTEQSR